VKETTGKLENRQLLNGCGIVQNIVPPSLSRDRRIMMEQANKPFEYWPIFFFFQSLLMSVKVAGAAAQD